MTTRCLPRTASSRISRKGNRELKDELMRTYHSCDVKSDFLDVARTRLKNTQDELVVAQGYIHHIKTELHE
jgi:hypothetical protein